jgi:hypothetical protein
MRGRDFAPTHLYSSTRENLIKPSSAHFDPPLDDEIV